MAEKDEKTCFHAQKNDFEQQTACEAPIRWLNYTTCNNLCPNPDGAWVYHAWTKVELLYT